MNFDTVFIELSAVLLFSVAVGAVGLILRQPLIVSFLAAGVLAGPGLLGIVKSQDQMHLLAQFGVALLLFVVGLKLDLGLIRSIGRVALVTGLGQVLFTSVIGYFLCLALGLAPIPSVYVAVALTFSSTIIIVKLLSDKGEIDALHGRVALGFLIVQDIVVVLVMIALSSLDMGQEQEGDLLQSLTFIVLKGVLFVGGLAAFARWAAGPLMHRMASSPELLVLFAVAWAVAIASGSEYLGFSMEMGAFLAGVTLASTAFRETVAARLVSLRDFLLLFFFIDIGSRVDLSAIGGQIGPAIWLSLFVLIGNPLVVMVIMGLMGYRKRTGFLAGLTVAQISEFSLIFAALGLSLGHLDVEHVGLVTLVGLITIGVSTYMILYSAPLYARLEPWLGLFERRHPDKEMASEAEPEGRVDTIVFGLGRFGTSIARGLRQRGRAVLGVDFDPEAVRQWTRQGHPAVYGDAADPEFLKSMPLSDVEWVIAAIPPRADHVGGASAPATLVRALHEAGYSGKIIVTANTAGEVSFYKQLGANVVLVPFADAAHYAVERLLRDEEETPEPAMEALR